MKIHSILSLIMCVSLLLVSCNQQNTSSEDVIEVDVVNINDFTFERLKAQSLVSISSGCFTELEVVDTLLVLTDRCGDLNVKIYSKSGQYINSFGRTGDGPTEFRFPLLAESDDNGIWIHDVNHKALKYFDKEGLAKGNGEPQRKMSIHSEMLGGFELNKIGNDSYVGTDHIYGAGNFFIYDETSGKKNWFPFGPDITMEPDENKLPLVYSSFIRSEPKKDAFVLAFRFFNQIRIHRSDGELLRKITIGDLFDPDFKTPSKWMVPDDAVYAFKDLQVTDNHIYGLYSGLPQDQILDSEGHPLYLPTSHVFVLDWDGNLKGAFELDQNLTRFTADENAIFGISEDQELGTMKVYSYPIDL